MVVLILWLWILFTWLIGLRRAEWCWGKWSARSNSQKKRFLPTSLTTPHYCNSSGSRVILTRAGKSSQYGYKMILRVIKDFFYLSNLWTRLEGVDNLTAFDSVMLKRSFSHGGAYLSLNCCKKKQQNETKKKRMSGIVRTLSLLSISYWDISSCTCHHISIHL